MTKVYSVNSLNDLQIICENTTSKLIVMDLYAQWCGPCKMLSPKIDSFSNKYTEALFIKVDVDIAEDIANYFNVSSMPTIIFIKNCTEIDRIVGANVQKIEDFIKKHV